MRTTKRGSPNEDHNKNQLIEKIAKANFPMDWQRIEFRLDVLERYSLTAPYSHASLLSLKRQSSSGYTHLVLALIQSRELRTQNERLRGEMQRLRAELEEWDYVSPLWEKAKNEMCYFTAEQLRMKAAADECQHKTPGQRRDDQIRKMLELFAAESPDEPPTRRRRTKRIETPEQRKARIAARDKARDRKSRDLEDVLWHLPMTPADYKFATGRSRRTIEDFIRAKKLNPMRKRNSQAEKRQFGPEANFVVLRHWLSKWIRNLAERRARFLNTIGHCAKESRPSFVQLCEQLSPVVPALKLQGDEKLAFLADCREVLKISKPVPRTRDPFISAFNPESRGENEQ